MIRVSPWYYLMLIPVFLVHVYFSFTLFSYNKKHAKINVILDELAYSAQSSEEVLDSADTQVEDERVANLMVFFRTHNSDLYEHAEFIVKTSDKYELDYRLLPAIAMKESTLCKYIPKNSHNCWGWGIYGNTVTRFSSYPEAIETVAKGLKTGYKDQGLETVDQIMSKYNPVSPNGSWAKGVTAFMDAIHF